MTGSGTPKRVVATGGKRLAADGDGGDEGAGGADPGKSRKVKTELEQNLMKLKSLGQKWRNMKTEASDLLATIKTSKEWSWAKTDDLQRYFDKLKTFRERSNFWEHVSIMGVPELKKKFGTESINNEIRAMGELEAALTQLEQEVTSLRALSVTRAEHLRKTTSGGPPAKKNRTRGGNAS